MHKLHPFFDESGRILEEPARKHSREHGRSFRVAGFAAPDVELLGVERFNVRHRTAVEVVDVRGDRTGIFVDTDDAADDAVAHDSGDFCRVASERAQILDDKTPTLREKLLRFCGPMLDEQGCSRTARIIRLVWAEGLHNPKLVAPFYHGLVAPILELHRENLRLAAHEHPHPALQRFPQLLVSPIMQGLLWQGMFKDKAPLDVKELYIAYLDIILPEKIRDFLYKRQATAPPEAPGGCRKRVPVETWVFHAGNAIRLP